MKQLSVWIAVFGALSVCLSPSGTAAGSKAGVTHPQDGRKDGIDIQYGDGYNTTLDMPVKRRDRVNYPGRAAYTHHLFTVPATRREWEARRGFVREQILCSAGLWPMPDKTPLKPLITGRHEFPDFTVENVALLARPGFYLCGNLYRPKNRRGPFPAIVNPHGHWTHGRLEMEPDLPLADPHGIAPDGRANFVVLAANLARQGYIVFAYDMVGYDDTQQVSHAFAAGMRPWLWSVSAFGLQLWDSIRVVDYLRSLPEVDKGRIGVTGASGGGTQTFMLCAVDDRVQAGVPINMVSATSQGGCICEEGPGLRIGTDNVEISALLAPKPLLLISTTSDWTRNVPVEEWPAVRKVYDLYGADDRTAVRQFNYHHNCNIESREAMYAWFGRWLLKTKQGSPLRETPFEPDTAQFRVWTAANPRPADALDEPALIESMIRSSTDQLASLWPRDAAGLNRFRATLRPALGHSLAISEPRPAATRGRRARRAALLIVSAGATDETPFRANSEGVDVRHLHLDPLGPTPDLLKNGFMGYNRVPLGDRVQLIVDALRGLQATGCRRVTLIGLGPAGLWSLLARAVSGVPGRTAVDVAAFANTDDQSFLDRLYAPGLRRAGDVRTAAMLSAPDPLLLFNTGDAFKTAEIAAGFHAVNADLRVEKGDVAPAQLLAWAGARN